MPRTNPPRPAHTLVALAATGIAVAGVAVGGLAAADAATTYPQLAISSGGTAKHPTYTAPATAAAGPTEITYTNHTKGDPGSGQLIYVDGTHTDAEILAALKKAEKEKPVPSWFHGAAGPNSVAKGRTSSAVVDLKAGNYYVLGGADGNPKAPLVKIAVAGTSTSALPRPESRISAREYTFTAKDVRAGQPLLLSNHGMQWHHFLAARLKKGASVKQARSYLLSDGKKKKSPFADMDFFQSSVLDPGYDEIVTAPRKAGNYVFFCFLSDKTDGGPPHIAKGMIRKVKISK